MSSVNLDSLRAQLHLQKHIASRDRPKRYAAVAIMLLGLWIAGEARLALSLWLWITVTEAAFWGLLRLTPAPQHIGKGLIAALLIGSSLVASGYFLTGLALTLQPDVALTVLGFMWLLSSLYSTLVMYHAMRAVYWTTTVVGFPITLGAALVSIGKDIAPAGDLTWALPAIGVVMTFANLMQQLREYRDTHAELEGTRAQLLSSHRRLEHMSRHDPLTGLMNRAAFSEHVARRLARAGPQSKVALLMVDLDGFKPINDTYGHEAGDAVLNAVADRLREVLRPGDEAFRLGGDEFAVLMLAERASELSALGDRLSEAISRPVPHRGKTLLPAASIGGALTFDTKTTEAALCACADAAMFEAKTTKSRQTRVFDPQNQTSARRAGTRVALEKALREDSIRPVYSPKFTMDGEQLVGLEALARWHHPSGDVWLPEAFLPDLDELSMLPQLTHTMLKRVLDDMILWQEAGLSIPRVSLNVAPVALATPSGRQEIEWILTKRPGFEDRLAFEITEDVYVIRASDHIVQSLNWCRAQGIALYLDDFGTGYGSYRHLQLLTPDQLKLDGALVAGIGKPGPAEAALAGFIGIAHGLGIKVVAEQVETEAQRARLAQMGCDYGEGHLFSAELSSSQVPALLKRWVRAPSSLHPPRSSSL